MGKGTRTGTHCRGTNWEGRQDFFRTTNCQSPNRGTCCCNWIPRESRSGSTSGMRGLGMRLSTELEPKGSFCGNVADGEPMSFFKKLFKREPKPFMEHPTGD